MFARPEHEQRTGQVRTDIRRDLEVANDRIIGMGIANGFLMAVGLPRIAETSPGAGMAKQTLPAGHEVGDRFANVVLSPGGWIDGSRRGRGDLRVVRQEAKRRHQ